ncbi:hypothetical protein MTO96_000747 [Rhipicephalus appendiculatus]
MSQYIASHSLGWAEVATRQKSTGLSRQTSAIESTTIGYAHSSTVSSGDVTHAGSKITLNLERQRAASLRRDVSFVGSSANVSFLVVAWQEAPGGGTSMLQDGGKEGGTSAAVAAAQTRRRRGSRFLWRRG